MVDAASPGLHSPGGAESMVDEINVINVHRQSQSQSFQAITSAFIGGQRCGRSSCSNSR